MTHTEREYLRRDLIMLLLKLAPQGSHEAYSNQAEFRSSVDYMILTLEPLLKVMYDSSQEAARKRRVLLADLQRPNGPTFASQFIIVNPEETRVSSTPKQSQPVLGRGSEKPTAITRRPRANHSWTRSNGG